MGQQQEDWTKGPWVHSTYKGCVIMRNCEEPGYWTERGGMIIRTNTLAAIRCHISVKVPTMNWRDF